MNGKINFAPVSRTALFLAVAVFACFAAVRAQTSAFTYQGRFTDAAVPQPTSGSYNMQFRLFDSDGTQSAGTQIGAAQSGLVSVVNGIFTVKLDFGAQAFAAPPRFLEIQVGTNVLTPRQEITSAPFSNRALSAANADALSSNCVSCVTNAQINSVAGSKVTGTVSSAVSFTDNLRGDVTGTQNNTVVSEVGGQTAANIADSVTATRDATNLNTPNTLVKRDASGSLTAATLSGNIVNAETQFNLGGNRIFNVGGTGNTFAGLNTGTANTVNGVDNSFFGNSAGIVNTTGNANSFFGTAAGFKNTVGSHNTFSGATAGFENTTGSQNSFFGLSAGRSNTTGSTNSFFGNDAGFRNATGSTNSFFGNNTGLSNTTGNGNSFFGGEAGLGNTTGSNNSFFGLSAGSLNTTGIENSFFGRNTGLLNTLGSNNTFIGRSAGFNNRTGNNNTVIGFDADVGASGLSFATALGSGAIVGSSNTVVLGRTADTVIVPNLLRVNVLGAAGDTSLCRNAANQISTCTAGNLAEQRTDATRLNALQTQNAQILEQLKQQQLLIGELKKLVCAQNPNAAVCQ